MIHFAVYEDERMWRVGVYVMESCDDGSEIVEELARQGCRGSDLADAITSMKRCKLNTGITYSNMSRRNTVMVIGRQSNDSEFVNTMRHEQHHVVSHICQADGVDMNSEEAAYMAGDIGQAIFDGLKKTRVL